MTVDCNSEFDHALSLTPNFSWVLRRWIAITIVAGFATATAPMAHSRALEQASKSSPSPRVSAQFEAEVSKLNDGGLKLKEALEASLEAGGTHLVAIFQREKPANPSEGFEFRIIENVAGVSKTIFRRTEFFFSFPAQGELARLNATDINGDGVKEIIVQSSSGGNCWSCNPAEIYQVRNHKAQLIAAGPLQKLADLNGDGIAELLVIDARWEVYGDLSHAAAPSATMVYAWQGGRYVYASRDFASFYRGEIERLRAALAEASAGITADEFSDEAYVGRAIALALTYAHMGDLERGLKELETLMNSNVRSDAQAKKRASVIEDFRRGESAKRLRELKYGDPMQLQ